MDNDSNIPRGNNIDDSELDERDLYAEDGGDGPDSDYPFLTEYQAERFQDLITEAEFAYEASPIETATPENQIEVEAAEKNIFAYVGLLMAAKDARIAALEARQITPEPVSHKDQYGTSEFSGREFDGWVARLGHGCIRRGDDRICFTDAQEMKDFAAMLLGMIAVSEENGK